MRLNRFYLENFSNQKNIILDQVSLFHQIKNVLKMKTGDFISLFFAPYEAIYKIEKIDNKKIFLTWQEDVVVKNIINKKIVLFQSLIKKDKMEWVVQKAVELGVSEIIPIISERSEKKDINLNRLNKILIEASEQCGRVDLIKISPVIKFSEVLQEVEGISFLGDGSGDFFVDKIKGLNIKKNKINIFIGPEGGWSIEELELAKKNKVEIVSLNNNILRSETATVAFLSLISNCLK